MTELDDELLLNQFKIVSMLNKIGKNINVVWLPICFEQHKKADIKI